MRCPFRSTLDVGDHCPHDVCWMWRAGLRGNCMSLHVGSTKIFPLEVAGIESVSLSDVARRQDRGRDLLKEWLGVVALAGEAEDACPRCGSAGCGPETCHTGEQELKDFARRVPLQGVIPDIRASGLKASQNAMKRQVTGSSVAALFPRVRARTPPHSGDRHP